MEEAARTTYEAARQEMLYRMRLRDHALLVYIAFVGAIFSVVFTQPSNTNTKEAIFSNPEALFSIPFLALGVSILVSQHYMMTAALGQFCTNELGAFVKENSSKNAKVVPQWDNSKAFEEHAATSALLRVIGHTLIILIPCFLALIINSKHAPSPVSVINLNLSAQQYAWISSFVFFISASIIIGYAHMKRTGMYSKRWKQA